MTSKKSKHTEERILGIPSKRSRKHQRNIEEERAEERRLTSILFGDGELVENENPSGAEDFQQFEDSIDKAELFEIDRVGDSVSGSKRDHSSLEGATLKRGDLPDRNPDEVPVAWKDEDDDLLIDLQGSSRLVKLRKSRSEHPYLHGQSELESRLRNRYQTTAQLTARTDWAEVIKPTDDNNEVEDEHVSEPLLLGSSNLLPPNLLNAVRCPDANQSDPNQASVQVVQFHPGSDPDRPLLLTAGFDKTLRFFQVGVEKSEKVHGIHFPKLPIYSASFLGDSGNVIVSGRRPFFYVYDAVAGKLDHIPRIVGRQEKSLERFTASPDCKTLAFCGNDGYIILFDISNKQWIADLKMNGSVRAVTFSSDGTQLIASGSDGDVYRWDMRSRQCIDRFSNEDGTITSSLAVTTRHLAVGAESGVVNLYSDYQVGFRKEKALRPSERKPLRSIMNLHTSADLVRFNDDGQILAMSTRREKAGLKLLHVPTATVFSNWPTSKTPLHYVWSLDFSPRSRFFAVGNDQGQCLLYRLMHYQDQRN